MTAKRCPDKVRYRDRIAALMALGKVRRKDATRETVERRAYHCPHCRGWHLTSQQKRA